MATPVVYAEDSFLVREGVRMLLAETAEVSLLAACETYDELLAAVDVHRPQVVITDVRMPPTRTDEGVRAALEIRSRWPNTGVVVLSQYADPDAVLTLFRDGTAGLAYLLKERVGDLDQVVDAVNRVRDGGSLIDPRVVEVIVGAHRVRSASSLDRLTPRELEVLERVAEGKTNAGIARDLYLSERAVEKHLNSVFSKLDLSLEQDVNKRVRSVILWLGERQT